MKLRAWKGLFLAAIASLSAPQLMAQEPAGAASADSLTILTESATAVRHETGTGLTIAQATHSELGAATCNSCQKSWGDCGCGNQIRFFGEYLLLNIRGADPVYAVEAENCDSPPIGDAHQLNFGSDSGWAGGVGFRVHGNAELIATYTSFESQTSGDAVASPGNILLPLVFHNPEFCENTTFTASARSDIDFDLIDLDYMQTVPTADCRLNLNWLVGVRYGDLDQELYASFEQDTVFVRGDVDTSGIGVRLGGGAEYGTWIRGFTQANVSLLASNIQARYSQVSAFDGQQVRYKRDFDRIIPVLDLRLGLAMDVCKNVIVRAGYEYRIWWNMVTLPGFVSDVQSGGINGGGVDDVLTFDGLFARLEFVW